jgi:glycosyltransferase involved in cell wall biosynthesis
LRCFIAGQGELEQRLKAQIASLGLQGSIKLLGFRDDIPSLLAAADIFCMPSLSEALGYSLLEAMAAGIPVVASEVGGIPEVITNAKEGLLVPPADPQKLASALGQLATDTPLREDLGSNGRQTVRAKFSLDAMLARTRQLFLSDGIL